MVSPQCVFSYVAQDVIILWESLYTVGTFVWPLLYVSSSDVQNCCSGRKPDHNDCIDMVSPQCVFSCVSQDGIFYEKAFPQLLHWYGLSPVCLFKWCLKLLFWKKTWSQWLHIYGFSPVCILMCISRWYFLWESLFSIGTLMWSRPCV